MSFGANLPIGNDDLTSTLTRVIDALSGEDNFQQVAVSRGYATPAWPPDSGPEFLNAAIACRSASRPEAILRKLHEIETMLGRLRPVRWGPRVCDLDLLAVGGRILPDRPTVEAEMAMDDAEAQARAPKRLILPHPRMHRRAFVLVPLAELAPDWRHPITGATVAEMAAALPAQSLEGIRPLPG